jgi:hypothetical protein
MRRLHHFLSAPNGLRLSRLADCAGLGSSIYQKPQRTYQRRLHPKANSVPTAGWAVPINYEFYTEKQFAIRCRLFVLL